MEVRKKRPRGLKKEAQGVQVNPLNPLSVAPCIGAIVGELGDAASAVVDTCRRADIAQGQAALQGLTL